jgi:hypothetical protein
MFDSTALEGYTPEQQLVIKEHAAGYLVTWTKEHIDQLISPDVGDGFDAPAGLFETEEREWEAHSAVCSVLDDWLDQMLVQAGFRSLDHFELQAGKYPTMPKKES